MRNLRHDIVHAIRRLLRTPLYTVFAAVMLAIGIAATTSLYSLLYAFMWRPDAVVDPERIVTLRGDTVIPGGSIGMPGQFSWSDWRLLAEQPQQSFTHVAAAGQLSVPILNQGTATPATGEGVTGDYFTMAGVGPLYGRVLTRADNAPDAPLVIVLSARLARSQFHEERRAVGRNLRVAGQIAEVIGVVTDNFYGFGTAFAPATFWLPLEHSRVMVSAAYFDSARKNLRWLTVRGRLRADSSLQKAEQEVSLIGRRLEAAFPTAGIAEGPQKGTPAGRYWRADYVSSREGEALSRLGVAMMGGVMLLLLMVCTNLANLGLARSAARRSEFAVRRSLGASRWRLVREQLVECSIVVGLGAVLAAWATRWLITAMHMDLQIGRNTILTLQPEVTWPVVAMAAGAAALSILLVGLGPAWQSTGSDLRPLVVQDSAMTAPRRRSQHRLVAAQVAGSVALLLLAISITQTVKKGTGSPGVDVDHLAVASLSFYMNPREPVEMARLREDILRRVRQSPGVEAAAASIALPFGFAVSRPRPASVATSESGLASEDGTDVYFVSATAELLPTLGIPLVSGRAFSEDEIQNRRHVILLSETVAREVFGTTDVVGRSIWFRRGFRESFAPEVLTVVGVSRDTDTSQMGNRSTGLVFLPFHQEPRDPLVITARTAGDTAAVAGLLRRAIRETDPSLVVESTGSGWKMLSGRFYFLGALAAAASVLGALTLALVMTGLFGVLSALVTQQMREFGIRMALGSTSAELLRFVIWQGLRPARDGLIIGLLLGVLSRVALGAILPSGLTVIDVFAFVVVPLMIVATTVASSIIPARRAARVDPNEALRTN
jgi:predicted permease